MGARGSSLGTPHRSPRCRIIYYTWCNKWGDWSLSHVAHKFERLLETYRREDGGKWSGIQLERATGCVVTRSYVTNLRKGRIENPGMDKLAAIASRRWASPRRSGSRRS